MYDTSLIRRPPSNRLVAAVSQLAASDDFNLPNGPIGPNWTWDEGPTPPVILNTAVTFPAFNVVASGAEWNTPATSDGMTVEFKVVTFDKIFEFGLQSAGAVLLPVFVGFSIVTGTLFQGLNGNVSNAYMPLPGDIFRIEVFGTDRFLYLNGVLFLVLHGEPTLKGIVAGVDVTQCQSWFDGESALAPGGTSAKNFRMTALQFVIL